MLKKVLTKSGRRILRAIKKLSTKKPMVKKSQNSNTDVTSATSWPSIIPDHEEMSLSWSLTSLDTKSVDTYVTYVVEGLEDNESRCCCCKEYEENQKNENRENEMII
ncbi:uncharacterized protein LOC107270798 [Cephus cinctus]|uniref:Uncharacterized protein LOC107270798 n=1 Tax=Cephus cinctus TaxID=211228 RepID=A0AAJ7C4D8_CEPCN|nr:uncharacterized protein LOC107270798 [Cephus cinctus]